MNGLKKKYEKNNILNHPKYFYVDLGSEFKGDVLELLKKT
jgi:hypothetical protein